MKYIEIDGKRLDIEGCDYCPCYDDGDEGYGHHCQHPEGSGECLEYESIYTAQFYFDCPLNEVKKRWQICRLCGCSDVRYVHTIHDTTNPLVTTDVGYCIDCETLLSEMIAMMGQCMTKGARE